MPAVHRGKQLHEVGSSHPSHPIPVGAVLTPGRDALPLRELHTKESGAR